MVISNAGLVHFYAGHGDASDASLKSPPVDADTENCLQMLRSVSARNYIRTDMPGANMRVGFVAQEVRDALPAGFANIVNTAPYGSGAEEREILILDYARLICPLWQSCRSMLARIEQLEERVAQLCVPQ